MIREQLQKGLLVQYRSGGNSMWPHVHSGDCCLFEPVVDCFRLRPNDIVFCRVQPYERYFAHKIIEIESVPDKTAGSAPRPRRKFWIGNADGWCHEEHIYGKFVEVLK